jgi:hypothetical protein
LGILLTTLFIAVKKYRKMCYVDEIIDVKVFNLNENLEESKQIINVKT